MQRGKRRKRVISQRELAACWVRFRGGLGYVYVVSAKRWEAAAGEREAMTLFLSATKSCDPNLTPRPISEACHARPSYSISHSHGN